MPTYSVTCETCRKAASVRLSFSEYDLVKGGQTLACPHTGCEGKASIVFNPGEVAFVLKDGESGGWVSKAGKENAYRATRRKVMAQRERDHVFKSRLQPNFGGELTGTWQEARDAAYENTYDRIKQEHGAETARQAATESAKTYEPLVSREVT
jgi:hypothetical protein